MDLHAVGEVAGERRLQHFAHVRVVVPQAREALARVEVQVGAAGGVVEVGALRRGELLVEAEDAQHVDQRGVEVAGGQRERFVEARSGVGGHAKCVCGGHHAPTA